MIFDRTIIKYFAKKLNHARLNENLNDIENNEKNIKKHYAR